MGISDFVISPYVVNPEYRGRGVGTQVLVDVNNKVKEQGNSKLYALLKQENLPSIKVMEKVGAERVGYSEIMGAKRKYKKVESPDAEYIIYRL